MIGRNDQVEEQDSRNPIVPAHREVTDRQVETDHRVETETDHMERNHTVTDHMETDHREMSQRIGDSQNVVLQQDKGFHYGS